MEAEECSSVEERIENSKRHWTHLPEPGSISVEEVEEADKEVFERLQRNPDWGTFFHIFRDGELVVAKEKFAEGAQAEIYAAQIRLIDSSPSQEELEDPWQWVVKVFKQGQWPLRDLQKQWPQGLLQFQKEKPHAGLSRRYNCDVVCGTLLKDGSLDGSFAFLMQREKEDLRTVIDRNMKGTIQSMWRRLGRCGPFSMEVAERLMYEIACGMEWLHDHNIVHMDLKAANVLVRQDGDRNYCFVADYECSVGVMGTGFFRAPEILQVIKDKSASKKPEIFSKEADIYSYGMTCYEILTGKLPFEGERPTNYDVVLEGRYSLQVPNYVDNWMCELLRSCWEYDPKDRPTFKMIKEQLLENSKASQGNEDIANSRYYWSQLITTISMSMLSEAEELRSTLQDDVEYYRTAVGEFLEYSEVHWSESSKWSESAELDVEITNTNREAFKALQLHPNWGRFFCTFGYDTEIYECAGELKLGAMIGEGGQAEIFGAHITWADHKINEYDAKNNRQWVLKVYKMGTSLQELQRQWPEGMLRFQGERLERMELAKKGATFEWKKPINVCDVVCGTLLEDGRFAHLLEREQGDLRELIEFNMRLRSGYDCGPFSKAVAEEIMHGVALGMDWLHSHDIVLRDLKAANVLITEDKHRKYHCFICDYESSGGVLGTGFWRAPEILQAIKDKNLRRRPELFSRATDVYSYSMTCYEILTGKIPFKGGDRTDLDAVINGLRPEVPEYVDDWARELLSRCWHSDPAARPSFGEILEILFELKKTSEENPLGKF